MARVRATGGVQEADISGLLDNYTRFLKYLGAHLDLKRQTPSAQAIKEIFQDPEERAVIIQLFGFGRTEISDSDYKIFAENLINQRKKAN